MTHKIRCSALLVLGFSFVLSAILKMLSIDNFELYLFSFGKVSFDVVTITARLIIGFEMLLGAMLVSRCRFDVARWLALSALSLFSVWLLWLWLSGGEDNCHCFGSLVELNAEESLLKNLILLGLLAVAWRLDNLRLRIYRRWVVGTVGVVALILPFVLFPADCFMRRIGSTNYLDKTLFMPIAEELIRSREPRVVSLYSTGCRFCRLSAGKLSSIISRHNLPRENFHAIFMDMGERQDSLVESFFMLNGKEVLPYSKLDARTLLRCSNGVLPLILLIEDGKVVEEWDYRHIDEHRIRDFIVAPEPERRYSLDD